MKLKLLIVTVLAFLIAGCTKPESARHTLMQAGYTDIQITGYSFFSCGKDDFYQTGFIAKGPTGMRVEGAVCEGFWFKNSTIRFD